MNYILVEEVSREARCTCIADQPPVTLKFFPVFIFHQLHSVDFTKTICVSHSTEKEARIHRCKTLELLVKTSNWQNHSFNLAYSHFLSM